MEIEESILKIDNIFCVRASKLWKFTDIYICRRYVFYYDF